MGFKWIPYAHVVRTSVPWILWSDWIVEPLDPMKCTGQISHRNAVADQYISSNRVARWINTTIEVCMCILLLSGDIEKTSYYIAYTKPARRSGNLTPDPKNSHLSELRRNSCLYLLASNLPNKKQWRPWVYAQTQQVSEKFLRASI